MRPLQNDLRIELIENPFFRDGSIVSLWRARALLRSGLSVILMDADILYDDYRLLDSAHENCFLLDRLIEPGEEPVKLCINEGHIVDFHKRPQIDHEWHGESVGFFRFSPAIAAELADRAKEYILGGRTHVEYEEPIRDMLLARQGAGFGYEDITGLSWIEIDSHGCREGAPHRRPKIVCMRAGPNQLELAAFERDGFLLVRDFLDLRLLADVRRWTDEIAAEPEVPGRHMVYYEDSLFVPEKRIVQRIENFCPFHPGWDSLLRRGPVLGWTSALLGGEAVLFKDKINFKLPGGGGFKPHQDQQAGWTKYAPLFLTALLCVDDATIQNGCLEIAAGRHKEGLIGKGWEPLEPKGLALEPVPTKAGDAIFFDSFVPHASGPNETRDPRRILYVTYALAKYGDHRERYFADKRRDFPPDIEREPGQVYMFRV